MPETLTERFAALAGIVVATVLIFLAFSARADRSTVPTAAPAATPSASSPEPTVSAEPPAAPVTSRPEGTAQAAPKTTVLLLTAARGSCWVSVHAGSADGEVLYEGIVADGRTVRVQGARLWVRLGAAANLDLTLNGKKVPALAAGTVDVIATPTGVRAA
jgi:hypothetical protein